MNESQSVTTPGTGTGKGEVLECALRILGAGVAGLNALFAASRHLQAHSMAIRPMSPTVTMDRS